MAEITAAAVGKLREMTNAGLMDCKRALTEAKGDLSAAVDILRKKGVATAEGKASREAREGVIVQHILPGSQVGVLVEINCETDFVAKNETFRAFCDEIARKLAVDPQASLEADRVAAVAKIVEGKLEKFFQNKCLLDQGFVKRNSEVTVKEHLGGVAKQLGDEITIRRFIRFQVGETAAA